MFVVPSTSSAVRLNGGSSSKAPAGTSSETPIVIDVPDEDGEFDDQGAIEEEVQDLSRKKWPRTPPCHVNVSPSPYRIRYIFLSLPCRLFSFLLRILLIYNPLWILCESSFTFSFYSSRFGFFFHFLCACLSVILLPSHSLIINGLFLCLPSSLGYLWLVKSTARFAIFFSFGKKEERWNCSMSGGVCHGGHFRRLLFNFQLFRGHSVVGHQ